jgi:hypothetical protein
VLCDIFHQMWHKHRIFLDSQPLHFYEHLSNNVHWRCVPKIHVDFPFQYSVWLRTGRTGFDPRQRQTIFPLTSASRPALGPTQPPIQWVPGALSPGVKRGRDVMLTAHPLLVPRLRKSRSYTSCHPNAPLWSVTGPIYLFLPLP